MSITKKQFEELNAIPDKYVVKWRVEGSFFRRAGDWQRIEIDFTNYNEADAALDKLISLDVIDRSIHEARIYKNQEVVRYVLSYKGLFEAWAR